MYYFLCQIMTFHHIISHVSQTLWTGQGDARIPTAHFLRLKFPERQDAIPTRTKQGQPCVRKVKTLTYVGGFFFFLVNVLSGANSTSSLNMNTLKNISLCEGISNKQTNCKENVESGPWGLFCIPLPVYSISINNISAESTHSVN